MGRSGLNKAALLLMLCLAGLVGAAQEVLNDVKLEKVSNQVYRVRYKLNSAQQYELNGVNLVIYRRRNGVVEEIHSEPLNTLEPTLNKAQSLSHSWKPSADVVKEGDELQAKVLITYNNPSLAKKADPLPPNSTPTANAGSFMEINLPVTKPIVLDGSKSYDSDGKIVTANWKQIGGPTNLTVTRNDSSVAIANGEFKEGRYAFELTVTDERGASDIDRIMITVRPPDANTLPKAEPVVEPKKPEAQAIDTAKRIQPVANTSVTKAQTKPAITQPTVIQPKKEEVKREAVAVNTPKAAPPKKDSVSVVAKKAPSKIAMPALKGGPSNALVNILVPGLGHYRVSGDQYGNDRKPTSFIITALYAGALGGAGYYKYKSTQDYKKYIDLAKFREEQQDANGDVIGIRGANEATSKRYLKAANTSRKNALILAGIGGSILAADLVYTFIKGSRHRKQWRQDAGLSSSKLFLSSDGTSLAAGLRVNL